MKIEVLLWRNGEVVVQYRQRGFTEEVSWAPAFLLSRQPTEVSDGKRAVAQLLLVLADRKNVVGIPYDEPQAQGEIQQAKLALTVLEGGAGAPLTGRAKEMYDAWVGQWP